MSAQSSHSTQKPQGKDSTTNFTLPDAIPELGRKESASSASSGEADYLKDSSLVAEAAKRAQVAVITRDLDDIKM